MRCARQVDNSREPPVFTKQRSTGGAAPATDTTVPYVIDEQSADRVSEAIRANMLDEAYQPVTHSVSVREVNQRLQSLRSIRRMDARQRKANALRLRFSKSLARAT